MATLLNNTCSGNIKMSTAGGTNVVQMGTGIGAPTGNENAVMGRCAMTSNNGGRSVAIGYYAAKSATSCCNIAIGAYALRNISSGNQNVALGYKAGCDITTGVANSGAGNYALKGITTGQNNTAVGFQSGDGITTCSDNTFAGANAGALNNTQQNVTIGNNAKSQGPAGVAIGENAAVNGTCGIAIGIGVSVNGSQIQWGSNSNNTCNCVWGNWISISDCRDKTDVTSLTDNLGLNFIRQLRPVSFRSDIRDLYVNKCGFEYGTKDGTLKKDKKEYGFIAQEVKSVADNLGITFEAVNYNTSEDRYKLTYEELIAPIVKAIQTIDIRVQALKSTVLG